MVTRRTVLTSAAASPLVLAGCQGPTASAPGGASADGEDLARLGRPVASFVSTPDLFNGDVGDLSVLPRWDGGQNSINDSWRRAIDHCLGALARHEPDAVFVAGDLVEGRWNLDTAGRALFGQVGQGRDADTLAACRRAITTAGGVYYGHYRQMFAERGLRLLPAVGDHELLDDRKGFGLDDSWSPGGRIRRGQNEGEPDNRYYLVPHAKDTWADHFTTVEGRPRFARRPRGTAAERTAYAVDLGRGLTLVTVDVFTHTATGVRLGVFGAQLAWLRRTVRAAKRQGRVVIVQGHVPILRPYRSFVTGGLRLPDGLDSTLYRVLLEEGVDFYFCGEVHDTTVRQDRDRGPVQISHGSIFRYAFNYLHGRVYADGTTALDYYELTVERTSASRELWSTDADKAQFTELDYGPPVHRGRLVTRRGVMTQRTGKLRRYDPATDELGYDGHLRPERV